MRFPFCLYKAPPTSQVVKFVGGERRASGRGGIYLVGPRTTIARLPLTEQPFQFAFTELTADGQSVMVQGELHARLIVDRILERSDFTVDPWTDAYLSDDPDRVGTDAASALQTYVRREVQAKVLKDVLATATDLQDRVFRAIKANAATFEELGLDVVSLFVTGVSAANKDLVRALEAEAREKMLAEADRAVAARRQSAAEGERQLKAYEADTAQQLEERRRALVTARNENVLLEAKADAEAIEKRLAPYRDMDPQRLFALAFREMGATGRVGSITITPEVLAAMGTGRQNGRSDRD